MRVTRMRWFGCGLALFLVLFAAGGAAQPRRAPLRAQLTGPRLARALSDPSVARRVSAAEALGRSGAERAAVDALMEALPAEPAMQVRAAIARALAARGDSRAVPALIEALSETRGPDAEAIVGALSSFMTAEVVAALLDAFEDPDLQRLAADGIVRVGAKAIPSIVARLSEAPSPAPLFHVLGRIGSPLATATLVDGLSSDDPRARASALVALERIADPRAARATLAALDDPELSVRLAAVAAVSATGSREDAARLERLLTGEPEADAPIWRAILRLDARRAASALAALGSSPSIQALAFERPRPELLDVYARWSNEPAILASAAPSLLAAISSVGNDRAVELLAKIAGHHPDLRASVAVELALVLERHRGALGSAARVAASEAIRAVDDPAARLVLLAIAGDPRVGRELYEGLAGDEPRLRAAAAFALATADVPCDARAVRAAARTDDAELFRRMAEAALRCGVRARSGLYGPFLYGEESGAEAMAWAALSLRRGAAESRRALGRLLREALRSPVPRLRAGGARALAILKDRGARAAIVRLLDDRDPGVRRAAARALEVLGAGPLAPALEAAARVEANPLLRAALEDAARASGDSVEGFDRDDHGVYRPPLALPPGARLDLVDAAGRYRRFEFLPAPLVVSRLPEGPVHATLTSPPVPPGARPESEGTLAATRLGP